MVGMFTTMVEDEGGYGLLVLILAILLSVYNSGARSHFTASVRRAIAFTMVSSQWQIVVYFGCHSFMVAKRQTPGERRSPPRLSLKNVASHSTSIDWLPSSWLAARACQSQSCLELTSRLGERV